MKPFLILVFFCATTIAGTAKTVTEYILNTVDSGEGFWPCLFYELNYNTDISVAEKAKWHSLDEDESYWQEGVGPFSIDENKFLVTQWQSTVHPILIRRHFTLTAEDLMKIEIGTLNLTYSYDENPKLWLNGTLLTSASGWNDNNYATFRIPAARKKLLVEGDNVLCVSVQQGEGGGHIDYGLNVTYDPDRLLTDISNIQTTAEEKEGIYNLQGQRLPGIGKGIAIIKGKKILNK
ncbi:MAG: hypothetical protein J6W52_02285 [Bacteroidaceae bacterium]|nr:hypothetical protein [Bacteroidaceae bacterium]